MRAIMDALSPGNAARRIVFMKAAQVGATEAGNNWIGYVIHHAPGPMLAVQPTVELAKRFSRQRIDPLIAESPVLRERVKPQRSRDAGNTVLSKEFPAGLLVITGANSAVGLRSMPARYLFLDEVDAYPPSAGIGRAPLDGLAEIDPVADQLVEEALVDRLAALVQHAFGRERLGQRRGGADGDEPLEDHPDRRGLSLVNHQLAVAHVVAQRDMAAHPHAALAGCRDLVADALADNLPLELREAQEDVQRQSSEVVPETRTGS
jgi:hypothetical protein